MKRDFTVKHYTDLLKVIQNCGFSLNTVKDNGKEPQQKRIILRHDVDKLPQNSLAFAKVQHNMGIAGTYYFRVVPQSYDVSIIKEISLLGHEIGYHYETMDTCRGNIDKAYEMFCRNLELLRKHVPIVTFCMHGSPLSKYDNRTIWEKYDYKNLGLITEPYLDIDFNKIFYITDTGRRWDGDKVSIRDKALASNPIYNQEFLKRRYHSTIDIIYSLENGDFPDQAMMTFHPQRWTDNYIGWMKEFVSQNLKNQVKRFLVKS